MISQPRYLPAIGYLNRIIACDVFVVLDTVQHSKQDFEHRNRISDRHGPRWLSLSLDRSHGSRPTIKDLAIRNNTCLNDHSCQLKHAYRSAYSYREEAIDSLYKEFGSMSLVDITSEMLMRSYDLLDLRYEAAGRMIRASELPVKYRPGPLYLAELCSYLNATQYISGPNGRDYITDEFSMAGIEVLYHDHESPVYSRGDLPYVPWLAWIDALQHAGSSYVRECIASELQLSR